MIFGTLSPSGKDGVTHDFREKSGSKDVCSSNESSIEGSTDATE